jgi:hypothetical protein
MHQAPLEAGLVFITIKSIRSGNYSFNILIVLPEFFRPAFTM